MFVVKHNQEMVNKTFRFPSELLDKLECIAEKNKISVNALVMQMAEYALNNMEGGADGEQVRGKVNND